LAVLCTLLINVNAATIKCEYFYKFVEPSKFYECKASVTITTGDNIVESASGYQLDGKSNKDVTTVILRKKIIEVFPKNLTNVFRGMRTVYFGEIPNLRSFQRNDFTELENILEFNAFSLPFLSAIPKDTFYEMARLETLRLERMVTLMSLDRDLLINNRDLTIFSVQGPNLVTAIPPGFFRNQDHLTEVDFRFSPLLKISHTVFVDHESLRVARFNMAGCLNRFYGTEIIKELVTDINRKCFDIIGSSKSNSIAKFAAMSDSSSDESH
jgi:hypothetical protein